MTLLWKICPNTPTSLSKSAACVLQCIQVCTTSLDNENAGAFLEIWGERCWIFSKNWHVVSDVLNAFLSSALSSFLYCHNLPWFSACNPIKWNGDLTERTGSCCVIGPFLYLNMCSTYRAPISLPACFAELAMESAPVFRLATTKEMRVWAEKKKLHLVMSGRKGGCRSVRNHRNIWHLKSLPSGFGWIMSPL